MFLIDNLVLSPARGLLAVFREIHKAAQEEMAGEADNLRARLSELYLCLESGQISEAEFEAREKEILDRLDAIENPAGELEEVYQE